MRPSEWLFRYRRSALILIFVCGFWAPLDRLQGAHPASTWLWLSGVLASQGTLSMATSTVLVMGLAILMALLAALLRTWAAAYLRSPAVQDSELHAERVVADGPYRYVRNPLYVGLWLYTLAVAILMPPSGALFVVIAVTVLILLLIRTEERNLATERGEAYAAYVLIVPRFFPATSPRVPAGADQARWMQAFMGEVHTWGVVVTYLAFADRYNATILIQGVLISLGISMMLRAFLGPSVPDAV